MKKLNEYFKLPRWLTSNKYEELDDSSTKKSAGMNKYMPHQGSQEKARRVLQMEKMK